MKQWFRLAVLSGFLLFFASCTKSGALTGGGASQGASYANTVNGSVNGGLASVSGATIALMLAGNPNPVGTATTAADGSYNIVFTNPGGTGLLYLNVTGGNSGNGTNANAQFLAIAGSTSAPLAGIRVNEITTAATVLLATNFGYLNDANGTITLNAPSNAAAVANMVGRYGEMMAAGNLNTGNSNLATATQNSLSAMANDFASCVENSANCSKLFNTAQSTSGSAAQNILEAGLNAILNNTTGSSLLYTLAVPMSASTGFSLPSSSPPSGFGFNAPLPATSHLFSLNNNVRGMAIDASQNLWLGGCNGNIVKVSSSGAVLGVFNAGWSGGGSCGDGPAVDAAGNVWMAACCPAEPLQEFSSSGTLLGNFSSVVIDALYIDSSGNVWGAGRSNGTIYEVSSSGTLLHTISLGDSSIPNIAIDTNGTVYASGTSAIYKISPSGTIIGTLPYPAAKVLAIDPSGNMWTSAGIKTTLSGVQVGSFYSPNGGSRASTFDAAGDFWFTTINLPTGPFYEDAASGPSLVTFTMPGQPYEMLIDRSGNVWVDNIQSQLEIV